MTEKATVLGPLNWLHVPLPLVGVLPFKCKVSCKQIVLSVPALAGVTAWYTVIKDVPLTNAEDIQLCTTAR